MIASSGGCRKGSCQDVNDYWPAAGASVDSPALFTAVIQ
jgi:hypothetical protein